MEFSNGYTATFYAAVVDPGTWQDIDRLEIVSGSISRNENDIRQSADLTLRDYDGRLDRWIRIYMDAQQGETIVHVPLFTGLATSPEQSFAAGVTATRLQCYSVLKAAADIFLQRGFYISRNTTGTNAIKRLLASVPRVDIDGTSEPLTEEIIAEGNESGLTMTDKILKAIGWQLNISGDGTVNIRQKPTEPAAILSPQNDVVGTSFTKGRDWFSCPNVFRATSGDLTAVARDDDPNSDLSTASRGREVWAEEDSVTLKDGESIAQYARRRLKELQERTETVNYTRRFLPEINVGDIVRLNYDDLKGDYRVTSQNITLGAAASTQEDAKRSI